MPHNPPEPGGFVLGLKAGFSLPPFMVFFGMIGFGSLARSQGIDLIATALSAFGIYGLPGQVAMVELYATSASLLAILTAVAMGNMRFLPMATVMIPTFERSHPLYRWRYLIIQLMSVNSWSQIQQVGPSLSRTQRISYFTAFGLICYLSGATGAVLGWQLAASMPFEITAALIFLNPAYFIFLFCANRRVNVLFSLFFGALLGPLLHLWSPDWGLPICGLLAGTMGYGLYKLRPRQPRY